MAEEKKEDKELETYPIENVDPDYKVKITDKKQLKAVYMPYVKNGGLFVTTSKAYQLNDEISISLKLLEESDEFIIIGKVVWINPKFAQGGNPQGIGIQFLNKEARLVRDKIENYLAGFAGDNETSMTM